MTYLCDGTIRINGHLYTMIRTKKRRKAGQSMMVLGPGMRKHKVFHDNKRESARMQALEWIRKREGVEEVTSVGSNTR